MKLGLARQNDWNWTIAEQLRVALFPMVVCVAARCPAVLSADIAQVACGCRWTRMLTMVNSASGLLVVGVGRSGTSIATRLSLTLGLLPPRQSDLMPANYANPTGYWESVTLAAFNDALLAQIGATWWTPPPVETAALNTAPAEQRSEARQAFTAAFGCGSGWVWKDPRLTALLPFWDDVLGKQPVLVPVREPREVAASIAARDKLNAKQSLAVWERHTRLLWSALAGRQALICRYADLISDPTGWRRLPREEERAIIAVTC